jgi:hypothetical protein
MACRKPYLVQVANDWRPGYIAASILPSKSEASKLLLELDQEFEGMDILEYH